MIYKTGYKIPRRTVNRIYKETKKNFGFANSAQMEYEEYVETVKFWGKWRGLILWSLLLFTSLGVFLISPFAGVLTFIIGCIVAIIANIIVDAVLHDKGVDIEEEHNIDTGTIRKSLKNDMAASAVIGAASIAASAGKVKRGLDEIKDPDRWHKI